MQSASLTPPKAHFPASWTWFSDELLPNYVKKTYSPKASWKDKPFTVEDGRFFSKGIHELSDLFTENRPAKVPAYFNHSKFRSSYLLYFLPLQAAKFLTLFSEKPAAVEATLKGEVARIIDLGSGPATASIAFLLNLTSNEWKSKIPSRIEITLVDQNLETMSDGKTLLEEIAESFPALRGRVFVRKVKCEWKKFRPENEDTSLVLFGNVLNEAFREEPESVLKGLSKFLERSKGSGVLFLEPADQHSSQLLSQIRDVLLNEEIIPAEPSSLWGPCLHAGACPLSSGRDWCHFSVKTEIPGKWFHFFGRSLGREREWLKFSYLWVASPIAPAPRPSPTQRLVVSDPLSGRSPKDPREVLICEPEKVSRMPLQKGEILLRGTLIKKNTAPSVTKSPKKLSVKLK